MAEAVAVAGLHQGDARLHGVEEGGARRGLAAVVRHQQHVGAQRRGARATSAASCGARCRRPAARPARRWRCAARSRCALGLAGAGRSRPRPDAAPRSARRPSPSAGRPRSGRAGRSACSGWSGLDRAEQRGLRLHGQHRRRAAGVVAVAMAQHHGVEPLAQRAQQRHQHALAGVAVEAVARARCRRAGCGAAVRTSTALPWPMSAASSSNSPAGGPRRLPQQHRQQQRQAEQRAAASGSRIASSTPPATPAAPAHSGGAAVDTRRQRQAASHCSSQPRPCTAGGGQVPQRRQQRRRAMASGVTTSVTQGIATALASRPTSETCWNSSSVSGVSASVTTHCSRSMRAAGLRRQAGAPPRRRPASVANSTPTATKLSQKPGLHQRPRVDRHHHRAGQQPDTRPGPAPAAEAQQRRRRPASSTVRCDGTPQPLNSA